MMGPGAQGMQDGQGMMHGTDQSAPGTGGPMTSGTGGSTMDQMRAGCPMVIADADVEVADADKGVALTFTTQKGDVADLRGRVQRMAQMYEMHQGNSSMMWHQMGQGRGGMGSGKGMMGSGSDTAMGKGQGMSDGHMNAGGPMPGAKARVEDTGKGVRLVLTPTNASELGALRQHVRAHQEHMRSGECWMWNESAPAEGTK